MTFLAGTTSYEAAKRISAKLEAGIEVTDAEIGALYRANTKQGMIESNTPKQETKTGQTVPAGVPGSVHTAAFENTIAQAPYYSMSPLYDSMPIAGRTGAYPISEYLDSINNPTRARTDGAWHTSETGPPSAFRRDSAKTAVAEAPRVGYNVRQTETSAALVLSTPIRYELPYFNPISSENAACTCFPIPSIVLSADKTAP